MLTFRPKLGSERDKEWRCFFCLHVRTGTILLGSWHLLLHLIALGFIAAMVHNPNLLNELENESAPVAGWRDIGAAMPTPLSNIENGPSEYPKDHSFVYHDVDVGALVTVGTLAFTLMLIYGAARGKPTHLLPFFCLQIFDLAITMLTTAGYLFYVRYIHQLVADAHHVPWREQLQALPAPTLAVVVIGTLMLAICLKAYFISVVWRCYKYITMRAHPLHALSPFVISSGGSLTSPPYPAPAPDYSSLLPDYEEAVKQTPPPSYRAATLMATKPDVVPPPPMPTADQNQTATNTVVMLPHEGAQARV